MEIDQAPEQEILVNPPEAQSHVGKFMVIFAVLAALAIGEIFSVSQISSLRGSFETQQAQLRRDLTAQSQQQLSTFERSNAQQFESLRGDIDAASKRVGTTGSELRHARALVSKLQTEENHQAEALKREIALKADQQQLGALTQDVSLTRTDLDSTKKALDDTRSEMGMTKSELGTLIARNHDEIQELRRLGDRDYFEFTLVRKQPQHLAGVGLTLTKTNLNRHRFNLNLLADDMQIEKKDRSVNEPVFFYVAGSKKPYELVVNKVESDKVVGYISTPKGAVQTASRSSGGGR
jgi:hypothetical protein